MITKSSYSVTFEGAALSILCGASLGLGYNLLRFDDKTTTTTKKDDENASNSLVKSSLRAGLGGAIFNLGLYLVVPSWVRELWLYKGTD